MKTLISFVLMLLMALNTADGQEMNSYRGKVRDASTKKSLGYASVNILSTTTSNVTNSDGIFTINLPAGSAGDTLMVSYLGYRSKKIPLNQFGNKLLVIELEPANVDLKPVVIRPNDAKIMVQMAVDRIEKNYSRKPVQMTAFYREMIKKGSSYVSINEAILDINKAGYLTFRDDWIGLYKARGNYDINRIDTIMVKFQGGPVSALQLDIVKSPFLGVEMEYINYYYNYRFAEPVTIDNKFFYVIEFDQKPGFTEILYRGKLFVESETMAIGRVEFKFNVEKSPQAYTYFVRKKPASLKMKVAEASYIVNYKELNGKWYFDYSRTEVKFQAKWDKKWFRSNYTIYSELAVTDISPEIRKIESEYRFKQRDLISNRVNDFTDDNFWEGYNIIQPDESIDKVISRIIRQLQRVRDNR